MFPRTFAALLALAGITIALTVNLAVRVDVRPPVPLDDLGLAADHTERAAPVAAQMPEFFVVGGNQENDRKNVRLWEWARIANGGEHLPNFPQETGDCVSFGAKNAAEYFTYAAVGRGLLDSDVKRIYPPHIYGGSRVVIGRRQLGRSPGSVGAWAAEWVSTRGVLPVDTPGLPAYSGRIADEWGYSGVPQQFVAASKPFVFQTVSPVRSASDVRDAVCNGYPVTIASDFGTRTIKVQDGRRVAVRNARWPHQMCVIGYDGETASQPYYYVLNSWGPHAHPEPLQDEPPGGFWITSADCEYIVRQQDSFAFSGFDGFPAQEFVPDFSVVGAAAPQQEGELIMEPMWTSDGLRPDLQSPGTLLGVALAIAGAVLWQWCSGGRWPRALVVVAPLLTLSSNGGLHAQEFTPDFSQVVASARDEPGKTPPPDRACYAPDFQLLVTAPATQSVTARETPAASPPAAVTHTRLGNYRGTYRWTTGEVRYEPQPGWDYPAAGVYAIRSPSVSSPVRWQWQCQGGVCRMVPVVP